MKFPCLELVHDSTGLVDGFQRKQIGYPLNGPLVFAELVQEPHKPSRSIHGKYYAAEQVLNADYPEIH